MPRKSAKRKAPPEREASENSTAFDMAADASYSLAEDETDASGDPRARRRQRRESQKQQQQQQQQQQAAGPRKKKPKSEQIKSGGGSEGLLLANATRLLGSNNAKQVETSRNILKDFNRKLKEKTSEIKEDAAEMQRQLDGKTRPPQTPATEYGAISSAESNKELVGKVQEVIKEAHDLLRAFSDGEAQLARRNIKSPLVQWRRDRDEIKSLLECGRIHGEALVESLLSRNPPSQRNEDGRTQGERDEMAMAMLFQSRKAIKEEDTWGTVASEQLRAIAPLVRRLEASGDDERADH